MRLDISCLAAATDVTATDTIVLLADGEVSLAGVDSVVVNAESAARVIAAFESHGVDMPIDFEHSTVYKAPKGEPSIAAGWVKALEYVEGTGIVASVEWTDSARQLIEKKEYRYFSPVIHFNRETRAVEAISSVALTNTPLMRNIEALAASAAAINKEFLPMATKFETLARLVCQDVGGPVLDLAMALKDAGIDVPEGATMEDLLALAIQAVKDLASSGEPAPSETPAAETAAASLLAALGAKSAEEGVLLLKAMQSKADQVEALSKQIGVLEAGESARKIDEKMDAYIKANKINANDEDHIAAARKFAEKDFDAWVELMDATPAIVPAGRVVNPGDVKKDDRKGVIAAAVREYKADERRLAAFGGLPSWVNGELRESGHALLTDDETKTL